MTGVAVKEITNDTAPPSQEGVAGFMIEERRSHGGSRSIPAFVLLVGIAHTTAVDALTRRGFSLDPTSATGEVIPSLARTVRDSALDSATEILERASVPYVEYERRIAQLRLFAEEDDIVLNIASQSDFFEFACTEPQVGPASLVLLDNGNLRAVWRKGEQEIGVQFHGGGSVQYLISRNGNDGKITHEAQRCTVDDLLSEIEGAGLSRLIYE